MRALKGLEVALRLFPLFKIRCSVDQSQNSFKEMVNLLVFVTSSSYWYPWFPRIEKNSVFEVIFTLGVNDRLSRKFLTPSNVATLHTFCPGGGGGLARKVIWICSLWIFPQLWKRFKTFTFLLDNETFSALSHSSLVINTCTGFSSVNLCSSPLQWRQVLNDVVSQFF